MGLLNHVMNMYSPERSQSPYIGVFNLLANSGYGDNVAAYGGHIYSGEDEPNSQMSTSKPVYTNKVRQRPDGSYYYIDDNNNQWPMYEIGDNRYATYNTEGNISSIFNLNPAAVEAVKPSWAYEGLAPQQSYEKDLAKTTVKDLDRWVANALTLGTITQNEHGINTLRNANSFGDYVSGTLDTLGPAMFLSGPLGNAYRAAFGTYHLANNEGLPKTYREFMAGNYGNAAKSLAGDAFNALIATHGIKGSYNDALWGMNDYGNNAMRSFARPRIVANAIN